MTSTLRARWLAVALVATAMVPSVAGAEPRPGQAPSPGVTSAVKVATSSCADLRVGRIQELLRLEIATLVPAVSELPPLEVDLVCTGSQVSVTLRDPVTIKTVARDVTLGASADPERALALVASELFLASWAELLIQQRPDEKTRPAEAAAVIAKGAVERALPPHPSDPPLTIDLMAMGRERHLSAPLPTLGIAVRVGRAIGDPHYQWFAEAGWETGRVGRPSGRVDVDAAGVGVGLRWSVRFGKAELGISGSVSIVYVSLEGVSSTPAFFGAGQDGWTGEAAGAVDLSLTLRTLRLGVAVLGGGLAPGPVGLVDGATSVRLDGGWAGATCFAGLVL
jgi:hypothetical protein